jgi:predicted MFS family arabinose efflux permease
MVGPLESEFGWSRAEITSGLLVISIIAILAAPIVGMAMDRFGTRRIAIPGVLLYCGALALLGLANQSVVFWWLLWGLLGLANMFIAPMVWAAAINGRFDQHRGMALAFAMCGYSLAAVFVPYLTTVLIESLGWRGSYLALAMISCLLALPLVVGLFRDFPQPAGSQPANAVTRAARSSEVREQLRSPRFLKLAGAVVVFTVALCALTTNGVPVLIGEGFDRTTAAAIAGSTGLGSITGRLVGGYLLDRRRHQCCNAGRSSPVAVGDTRITNCGKCGLLCGRHGWRH